MSQPTTELSPNDRATTFQAVSGPQPEHYSGELLLVSAYAVLWLILLVWVAFVWRKQSGMSARLEELERELDRAAARRSASSGAA
jgi:hypothetical protein